MTDILSLDEGYSTTRLLTQEKPEIINTPEDKFETVLFLPEGENRKGEGGLRTKGYFKKSYKDKPLISIVTVVYNGEKYLEETILSVINQTYDNVEYIIIDGGSTDGTLDIIRKYEERIDYWVSERDNGIYDAMNKGIDVTNGDWIYFINLGDKLLYIPISKLKQNNIDVLSGRVVLVGHRQNELFLPQLNWKFRIKNLLHHQGTFYKKNLINHYSLEYKVFSDFDLNLSLFNQNKSIFLTDEIIASHEMDGLSHNKKYFNENFHIIRKHSGNLYVLLSFLYFKLRGLKFAILNFSNRL